MTILKSKGLTGNIEFTDEDNNVTQRIGNYSLSMKDGVLSLIEDIEAGVRDLIGPDSMVNEEIITI